MNIEQECMVRSESELVKAVEMLHHFAKGRKKIALIGELGAGKTAFVKAFCQSLNVQGAVTSPTFALVNEYVYLDEDSQEQLMHHLDLYRLKTLDEALEIGIEDYLFDEHYSLIEWPEILKGLLPDDMVFVEIEAQPDSSRLFLFSNDNSLTN